MLKFATIWTTTCGRDGEYLNGIMTLSACSGFGLTVLRIALGGVLLCLLPRAGAITFQAPLDATDWRLESSRFTCKLSQTIPDFGTATFEHNAGEELQFELRAARPALLGAVTQVTSEPPAWWAGRAPQALGVVEGGQRSSLRITSLMARDMLASLSSGFMPTFSNGRWMGTSEPVKVAISSANFGVAYDGYMGCVASLLPVNYRQVARSAVLFPSGQWRLSDATKVRLDMVALYVKNDPSVTTIYVDGHSDNLGRRLANRDLSRQRAEAVSRYLASAGISEEMITTRYHGERYPVVENRGEANRARNRRVTVRLERGE